MSGELASLAIEHKRREFSATTKFKAFQRSGGFCENPKCKLPLQANRIEYDHDLEDGAGGDNSLGNCVVLCKSCHSLKYPESAKKVAKVKRLARKAVSATAPKVKILSPGFAPGKQPNTDKIPPYRRTHTIYGEKI